MCKDCFLLSFRLISCRRLFVPWLLFTGAACTDAALVFKDD